MCVYARVGDAIRTLVSGRILILPALEELEELLGPTFLKKTHKRALDCLHLRAGNLGDLAITVDEAASDLLELKVTSDIGVNEDLGELARSDNKLGNEVNGIVAIAAQFCRRSLIWPELAVKLHIGVCSVQSYTHRIR